jgi:hypothetical protein
VKWHAGKKTDKLIKVTIQLENTNKASDAANENQTLSRRVLKGNIKTQYVEE